MKLTSRIRLLLAVLLIAGATTCGARSSLDLMSGAGGAGGAGGQGGAAGNGGASAVTNGPGGIASSTSAGNTTGTGTGTGNSGAGGDTTTTATAGTGGVGGTMATSTATTSATSTGTGGACVPMCNFDVECQMTCPPSPAGVHCCDMQTGLCYLSNSMMCPGPATSSSSASSSTGSGYF